jgi:ElaB/YqjD/DUF883 family membrane-anchored ribosome-binding protein
MQEQSATSIPQSGAGTSGPRAARFDSESQAQQAESAQTPSLTATAGQAVQSAAELYQAADSALQQQMETNPYVVLGAAAAVGFLLGGGMRSPIGQLMVRMSVRAFGPPLVNAALTNVLERATSGFNSGPAR